MFGEREVSADLGDNLVDIYIKEDKTKNKEINDIIAFLKLYRNDKEMLTRKYTELLLNDNVVDIFTKLSHNTIFMEQFPEFYEKNINGENVINCQQNSSYHRFGVFKHILYTIEIVGKENIQRNNFEMKILKWTMLLHDIGKPYVKVIDPEGSDSFAGHDDKSVEIAAEILDRFSFDEEEKNIILTLIKYHDRYLNEGELTFDNLSFLARELGNRKDLFYMLIDVKIADSKAKTIEVYNKFMKIINKYYSFATQYFENGNITSDEFIGESSVDIMAEMAGVNEEYLTTDKNVGIENSQSGEDVQEVNIQKESFQPVFDNVQKFEMIDDEDFKNIYNQMLEKKVIYPIYQPIVDLNTWSVYGYEGFNRIAYAKNVKILDYIQKSKDYDKYDKVQQIMFINSIETFHKEKTSGENTKVFAQIDVKSYIKYPNKPRINDMLDRRDIVVEINNYDYVELSELQDVIKNIKDAGGKILLNYFGTNKFTINDLDALDVDYIKYDIILLNNFEESKENQTFLSQLETYCLSRDISLIVRGVENIEQLRIIYNMGIKYVQGFLFGGPTKTLENSIRRINEVKEILSKDESIV